MPTNTPSTPTAQGHATEDRIAALVDLFARLSVHADTTDAEMVAAREKCLEAAKRHLLSRERA